MSTYYITHLQYMEEDKWKFIPTYNKDEKISGFNLNQPTRYWANEYGIPISKEGMEILMEKKEWLETTNFYTATLQELEDYIKIQEEHKKTKKLELDNIIMKILIAQNLEVIRGYEEDILYLTETINELQEDLDCLNYTIGAILTIKDYHEVYTDNIRLIWYLC